MEIGAKLLEFEKKLPQSQPPSFADLRNLFEQDREVFFELAGVEDKHVVGNSLRMLVRLARITAVLMRDGFELVTRSNQYIAEGTRGGFLPIVDADADARLLERLWSKSYLGDEPRGLRGAKGTVAEEQFFYGDFAWIDPIRRMRLLRIDPMDASAVTNGLPAYHRFQLLDCAREVVSCPLIIGDGLRTDGSLKKGQAYYGRPKRRWFNDGTTSEPPPGMLFAVYVDAEGSVFDWDWKCETECAPTSLATPTLPRFRDATPDDVAELIVGNVLSQPSKPFHSGHPWYSVAGDCVFCYFENREAYEERVDQFLTKYTSFNGNECVGFKLKYVGRLFELVDKWSKEEDEGIKIHVGLDNITLDLEFLMRAWLARSLPKRLPLAAAMKLMEKVEERKPEKVVIPRDAVTSVYTS
ncbi:MAG TPA: hypothetical protein VFE47_07475 [Tepidisphaeraceae bacterium]|jgi:hypothetical protein|nr:hypothetical protein [Tepidisphaeraceae bacterium]